MTRPKSTIPKRRRSNSGATIANSTTDCERCRPPFVRTSTISVAADCHVRVRNHVDRVAQHALHESRRETEVDDEDDVYIRAPIADVAGSGGQLQPGGVPVTDVEERLVDAGGRIRRVGIWRVVGAVSVSDVRAGEAGVLEL